MILSILLFLLFVSIGAAGVLMLVQYGCSIFTAHGVEIEFYMIPLSIYIVLAWLYGFIWTFCDMIEEIRARVI
jgi:hypothetical protein